MCCIVEEITQLTQTLTSSTCCPHPHCGTMSCALLRALTKPAPTSQRQALARGTGHSPGRLPQWHFRTPGKPPRWPALWLCVNRRRRGPFRTQSGLSQGHLSDQSHQPSTGRTLARCLDLKMRSIPLVQNVKYPNIKNDTEQKERNPTKNILVHAKR